ncbi:MAG: arylsulfatase [Planctomycetota bacterium]
MKPNIVLVITDDQGYGDLSCTGNPVLRTPHLDRFHDEAVRLTDFHVGPTCSPTRAGLMTGRHPGRAGVWHTIAGRSIVRQDVDMLPEILRDAGYATAMFGKWHLGDNFPYRPTDRGFDHVVQHAAGGITQQPDFWGNDYFDDTYLVNGEPRKFDGYCTDVWFDQALGFIEDHVDESPDRPFFCYVSTNAPHSPYNVARKYAAPYEGKVPPHVARFYGMIANLDDNFARLRGGLQRLAVEDNTIVIFMTDNGSSCPMVDGQTGHSTESFNAGLRGGKNSLYDGGHRVPFFVRWPAGGIDGGRDVEALSSGIDLLPTLIDICDIESTRDFDFDGVSLREVLHAEEGEASRWPRRFVVDSQRVLNPVRWRDSAVLTERWRLVDGKALYDIYADRAQQNNLADDHPDVVRELRAEYEAWFDRVYADADQPIPLFLGDPQGPDTVQLNSHDWRYPSGQTDVVWNQGQVRQGLALTGFWEVDVRRPGRYRVELHRWAREDQEHTAPDNVPLELDRENVDPTYAWFYEGGNDLELTAARVSLGEIEVSQPIQKADQQSVTFELDLPAGYNEMRAEFTLASGETVGAYYVYVTKLPDVEP